MRVVPLEWREPFGRRAKRCKSVWGDVDLQAFANGVKTFPLAVSPNLPENDEKSDEENEEDDGVERVE